MDSRGRVESPHLAKILLRARGGGSLWPAFFTVHWNKDYYFLKAWAAFPWPSADPFSSLLPIPSIDFRCFCVPVFAVALI